MTYQRFGTEGHISVNYNAFMMPALLLTQNNTIAQEDKISWSTDKIDFSIIFDKYMHLYRINRKYMKLHFRLPVFNHLNLSTLPHFPPNRSVCVKIGLLVGDYYKLTMI